MTYEEYMKLDELEKMKLGLSLAAAVIATSDGVVTESDYKQLLSNSDYEKIRNFEKALIK